MRLNHLWLLIYYFSHSLNTPNTIRPLNTLNDHPSLGVKLKIGRNFASEYRSVTSQPFTTPFPSPVVFKILDIII